MAAVNRNQFILPSGGTPGPTIQYRIRAWNTVTLAYEYWTSGDPPDLTPPSGDPVLDIVIINTWEI